MKEIIMWYVLGILVLVLAVYAFWRFLCKFMIPRG